MKTKVYRDVNVLVRKLQMEHGDLNPAILKRIWNGHWPDESGVQCENCGGVLLATASGVVSDCPLDVVREVLES